MSWSIENECNTCKKKDKCCDRHFFEGAAQGTHMMWPSEKGHLGAGVITMNCQEADSTDEAPSCGEQ